MEHTIIDLIDHVNDQTMFSEFDVLMSLCEVYNKSAMIMEASTDETIQEAGALDKLKYELHDTAVQGRYGENIIKRIVLFLPRLLTRLLSLIVKVVANIPNVVANLIKLATLHKRYEIPFDQGVIHDILSVSIDHVDAINNIMEQGIAKMNQLNPDGYAKRWGTFFLYLLTEKADIDIYKKTHFSREKLHIYEIISMWKKYLDDYMPNGEKHDKLFKKTLNEVSHLYYGDIAVYSNRDKQGNIIPGQKEKEIGSTWDPAEVKNVCHDLMKSCKALIKNLNHLKKITSDPSTHSDESGVVYDKESLDQFKQMRTDLAGCMNFFSMLMTKMSKAAKDLGIKETVDTDPETGEKYSYSKIPRALDW